ncbi:MAG: hypothetical protein K9L98_02040 [Candidatus Pacebacteria bacterium]|nr:hypothetical protein [Candidatus Paceibacterota bacterium]MCF7862767.1 hypothetical protein [Candidatus Paceibacterota bacterium]
MNELNKKLNKNFNSLIIEKLGEKPIAFNPILARISNSSLAGLFLSQLLFWWHKGYDRDWIYKTIDEIKKETGMTRSEQDRAIKIWKELGILLVESRGMPRKRHFHIDKEKLFPLLEKASGRSLYG